MLTSTGSIERSTINFDLRPAACVVVMPLITRNNRLD